MALTEGEKKADQKKEKPLTKAVIRRLPPSMTKNQFLNQISPIPDYNYMYHVKEDTSLGENAFSRAYINFVCPEDVYNFKEKFDNYVFVDTKGHEYTAVVEYAPFQKIPKKRGKSRMDPKCNTIESDTYYLEFVASLNKPDEPNEKPEYSLQLADKGDAKKGDITTPLLEFIKNKRVQKLKIKEVRREERERRRKEYEKRKEGGKYYEDKKQEERSPTKGYGRKPGNIKSPKSDSPRDPAKSDTSTEKLTKKNEKPLPENKLKEKKSEEKKERKEIKPRFPKKENPESKRDTYNQGSYSRPGKHYEEHKQQEEAKVHPKKVKKYSERREERKLEAQKAEQKKLELSKDSKEKPTESYKDNKPIEKVILPKLDKPMDEMGTLVPKDGEGGSRQDIEDKMDGALSSRRIRIRNKDRPTIALYRPGMLSKRKQGDDDNGKTEMKVEPKKENN
ncbi:regulator of nonsense transcripts 3B-like [Euwallacea fornicatus]|uniref:regulator of nonsense transcripts 3B-like n=1 Tax=Euwallacea fornicatus TaxID=995702 RepID=UPI00338D753F